MKTVEIILKKLFFNYFFTIINVKISINNNMIIKNNIIIIK